MYTWRTFSFGTALDAQGFHADGQSLTHLVAELFVDVPTVHYQLSPLIEWCASREGWLASSVESSSKAQHRLVMAWFESFLKTSFY